MNLDRNPQRQGNLEGPLMIVAAGPAELFVVRAEDVDDPHADAQMYELDQGAMVDQIKPLPIWLKFMYYVDGVVPAVPFTPAETKFRVEAYQAAKRAREAANGATTN